MCGPGLGHSCQLRASMWQLGDPGQIDSLQLFCVCVHLLVLTVALWFCTTLTCSEAEQRDCGDSSCSFGNRVLSLSTSQNEKLANERQCISSTPLFPFLVNFGSHAPRWEPHEWKMSGSLSHWWKRHPLPN